MRAKPPDGGLKTSSDSATFPRRPQGPVQLIASRFRTLWTPQKRCPFHLSLRVLPISPKGATVPRHPRHPQRLGAHRPSFSPNLWLLRIQALLEVWEPTRRKMSNNEKRNQ
jgi:hypothetical protein